MRQAKILLLQGLSVLLFCQAHASAQEEIASNGMASALFAYEGAPVIFDRDWPYGIIGVPGATDDDGDHWQFEVAAGFNTQFDDIWFSFFSTTSGEDDIEPFTLRFGSLDEGGPRIQNVVVESTVPVQVSFRGYSVTIRNLESQPATGGGSISVRLIR